MKCETSSVHSVMNSCFSVWTVHFFNCPMIQEDYSFRTEPWRSGGHDQSRCFLKCCLTAHTGFVFMYVHLKLFAVWEGSVFTTQIELLDSSGDSRPSCYVCSGSGHMILETSGSRSVTKSKKDTFLFVSEADLKLYFSDARDKILLCSQSWVQWGVQVKPYAAPEEGGLSNSWWMAVFHKWRLNLTGRNNHIKSVMILDCLWLNNRSMM